MAVVQKKLEAGEESTGPGRRTTSVEKVKAASGRVGKGKASAVGGEKKAGLENKSKGTGRGRPRGKGGAELLRLAADRELVVINEEVVKKLGEKALDGNESSVRALMLFSEGKKVLEKPKRKRKGKSQAELLSLQREWQDPADVNVDVRFGGREPEV